MQNNYKIVIVVALLTTLAVVLGGVSSTITVQYAADKTSDEKADGQADKGHVKQADSACQKGGYDGYIGSMAI